jgi:pyrophosphatase PpaX
MPSPEPRFDAVLFDLDGTLLDSVALIVSSYHHTLAAHGLAPRTDSEILVGLGTPLEAQLSRWADHAQIPALIDTYRAHNFAYHDAMVRPYPGVTDVVRRLKGVSKLAIVTSKRREGTRRGLASLGLDDCLTHLVCADDVTRAKPHPEPVERAVALLEVDRARTLFVGDSPHDMESGRAAGVRTCGVLWGPFREHELAPCRPDHYARDAAELAAIVL